MSASIIPTSSPRSLSQFSLFLPPLLFLFLFLAFTLLHFGPLLNSLPLGMASILPVVQHIVFFHSLPFEASSFFFVSLFRYSFIPPLFLLRFLALNFTLGPPSCAQRSLSPHDAHGARRSVIFKPFAL